MNELKRRRRRRRRRRKTRTFCVCVQARAELRSGLWLDDSRQDSEISSTPSCTAWPASNAALQHPSNCQASPPPHQTFQGPMIRRAERERAGVPAAMMMAIMMMMTMMMIIIIIMYSCVEPYATPKPRINCIHCSSSHHMPRPTQHSISAELSPIVTRTHLIDKA